MDIWYDIDSAMMRGDMYKDEARELRARVKELEAQLARAETVARLWAEAAIKAGAL